MNKKRKVIILNLLFIFMLYFFLGTAMAFELRGRVVDYFGFPIKGVSVVFETNNIMRNSGQFNGITNSEGNFSFDNFKGGFYIVRAQKIKYNTYSTTLMIPENGRHYVELKLKKSSQYSSFIPESGEPVGNLFGKVRDKNGFEIIGAVVTVDKDFAITDDSGVYRFSRLFTGNKKVKVIKNGYKTLYTELFIDRGDEEANFIIEKDKEFSNIYGKIRVKKYGKMSSLPPFKVIFGNRIAISDVNGRFVIKNIESGNHNVTVIYNKRELYSNIVKVDKGDFAFEILLDRLR